MTSPDPDNVSAEGQLTLGHPEVREAVMALPEFHDWAASLPSVVVDEDMFYIRGGDMLKDQDQILWEWVREFRPDLLPPGA